MKKILTLTLIILIFTQVSLAAKPAKNGFSEVIKDSGVDTESISVSIVSAENGNSVYSLNEKILMPPASVQKVLTAPAIADTLGLDYKFSTEIYSRGKDSYLIKLGADPYLTSDNLKTLVSHVSEESKNIYIDDTILDNKTWGEGWQWDDDMNSLMPRFGSYNLDKNLIKLTIMPPEGDEPAVIINPSKYPFVFFNSVTGGDKTVLKYYIDNAVSANTLVLSGTAARPTTIYIPSNNLKRYFEIRLTKALEDKKVYLKNPYIQDKKMPEDELLDSITHDMDTALNDILKNSNNMVAETAFKIAGAKHCGLETGTDTAGIKMFNDYCRKMKIDNSRIKIADASGVSKNNLISAEFITDFLYADRNNKVMECLPSPGEGTLTHRMLMIKGNLKAKTGTLADISSIAGYITAKSGKKYVFCIIINDIKLSSADKKMLEDYIIREAYLRL